MKPNNQKGGGGRTLKSVLISISKWNWKRILILVINAAILILFIEFFGTRGIWYWIIGIIILAVWRIFKGRQQFMTIIKYIETMIWTKPLDRSMWDKGEFKDRKKQIKLEKQQDIGRKIKLMRKYEIVFLLLFIISCIHAAYTLRTISFIAIIIFLIYSWGCTIVRIIYQLHQEVRNGRTK